MTDSDAILTEEQKLNARKADGFLATLLVLIVLAVAAVAWPWTLVPAAALAAFFIHAWRQGPADVPKAS